MSCRLGSLACVLILAIPLPATANWFRSRTGTAAVSSYYLGPTVCVPSYALVVPMGFTPIPTSPPLMAEPPRWPATPVPAPPSAEPAALTPGAPPMPPASGTPQSQSYYDAYAATAVGPAAASGTCSVGFWNSTARPVTIRAAGQVEVIEPGRGVTLELPRSFTWQLDDRQPQPARTPSGQAGLDIVIRR